MFLPRRRQPPPGSGLHQCSVCRSGFVAPVWWMGFPAILKGWLERVFAYGFAYTLTDALA